MIVESMDGPAICLSNWIKWRCWCVILTAATGCVAPTGEKTPHSILAASPSEPVPSHPEVPELDPTNYEAFVAWEREDTPLTESSWETLQPIPAVPSEAQAGLPAPGGGENPSADYYPIDLPTALRLAGANSLQVALAVERVQEAYAAVEAADAKWIPSLRGGVIYNKHDGRIQATEGTVLEANRGSLYVGGGVGFGGSPLNGASGGPARMFVDLSLSDLMFDPLEARQLVNAACADEAVVFNRTLLEAGRGYVELVRAQFRRAVFEEAARNAEQLARITSDFAASGEGYLADAERSKVELARWQRLLLQSGEQTDVASARLARIVRLGPTTRLHTPETQPVAVDLVGSEASLDDLIAQAIAARPELGRQAALVDASRTRVNQEHWRPWLPNLYAGMSGGGFGGNDDSKIENFSDRSDFDLAAIWELENFGLGNSARRNREDSRFRQASLAAEQVQDVIAEEVTRAYRRVEYRRLQIRATESQLAAATRALELNFDGIRGAVLRPIEAQQAIAALADSRFQHLDVVLDYNTAQLDLLHAVGTAPTGEVIDALGPDGAVLFEAEYAN